MLPSVVPFCGKKGLALRSVMLGFGAWGFRASGSYTTGTGLIEV